MIFQGTLERQERVLGKDHEKTCQTRDLAERAHQKAMEMGLAEGRPQSEGETPNRSSP